MFSYPVDNRVASFSFDTNDWIDFRVYRWTEVEYYVGPGYSNLLGLVLEIEIISFRENHEKRLFPFHISGYNGDSYKNEFSLEIKYGLKNEKIWAY